MTQTNLHQNGNDKYPTNAPHNAMSPRISSISLYGQLFLRYFIT